VENGDTIYVFDSAMLTAFDLKSGNVRWRLPAVGIVGLFFDDKGMLYVNSTTASPESLKYSRQIDFSQKTSAVVLKVNPATGKTLWTSYEGGFISYVSGKFLYMYEAYQADEDPVHRRVETGLEKPSHIAIRRLDPGTGHILWEHYQKRAPLDVKFDRNSILLVFKKEVQVLRFVSF
jgi:outer membrane protein assembly factor BamB